MTGLPLSYDLDTAISALSRAMFSFLDVFPPLSPLVFIFPQQAFWLGPEKYYLINGWRP